VVVVHRIPSQHVVLLIGREDGPDAQRHHRPVFYLFKKCNLSRNLNKRVLKHISPKETRRRIKVFQRVWVKDAIKGNMCAMLPNKGINTEVLVQVSTWLRDRLTAIKPKYNVTERRNCILAGHYSPHIFCKKVFEVVEWQQRSRGNSGVAATQLRCYSREIVSRDILLNNGVALSPLLHPVSKV
jgi:hypothetical protein